MSSAGNGEAQEFVLGRKWRYGCGRPVECYRPSGFTYKAYTAECGSTGHTGDPVQCDSCAAKVTPPPTPAYGDIY
jgi:hypothetical protein